CLVFSSCSACARNRRSITKALCREYRFISQVASVKSLPSIPSMKSRASKDSRMRVHIASYALWSSLLNTGGGPKSSLSFVKLSAGATVCTLFILISPFEVIAPARLDLGDGDACATAGTIGSAGNRKPSQDLDGSATSRKYLSRGK